jgi:two-component system cell cycle sensor histidine kinase/response regulator CckA
MTTRTETLLVVEDDHALRGIVAEALQNDGYTVLEAETPAQALEIAARSGVPIHLVISDVVLPGRTGPATATQIRDAHPGARVLLMSGYMDPLLDGNPLVEPGLPFLSKPFTSDALLRKVREVLDRREDAPS